MYIAQHNTSGNLSYSVDKMRKEIYYNVTLNTSEPPMPEPMEEMPPMNDMDMPQSEEDRFRPEIPPMKKDHNDRWMHQGEPDHEDFGFHDETEKREQFGKKKRSDGDDFKLRGKPLIPDANTTDLHRHGHHGSHHSP